MTKQQYLNRKRKLHRNKKLDRAKVIFKVVSFVIAWGLMTTLILKIEGVM